MDKNIIHFTDGTTLTHIGQVVKGKNTAMLHCIKPNGELKYIVPSVNIKYIETGEIKEVDITGLYNAVNDLLTYMDDLTQGGDHINMCIGLIKRYCNGDRTQVLYDQIMEVVICNAQKTAHH